MRSLAIVVSIADFAILGLVVQHFDDFLNCLTDSHCI
jgi:hypothetical protein